MSKRLVADIGGTNARFALLEAKSSGLTHAITYPCTRFPSFERALRFYLKAVQVVNLETICLAVAGPIINDSVNFTNNSWKIHAAEVADEFQGASVKLLNDFEAVAYALPYMGSKELVRVGTKPGCLSVRDNSRLCTIGPGTGLGSAGLLSEKGRRSVIVSEAGQVGFAPQTPVQLEVLAALTSRFGRISNERLLSGSGIENIYWALGKNRGEQSEAPSAATIFSLAEALSSGKIENELAKQTIALFFEILGQVAGDLALSLYAIDGLYIAGGIVRRYPKLLADSLFREGFENKGKYRGLMESLPTHLVTHKNPGLLGAVQFTLDM